MKNLILIISLILTTLFTFAQNKEPKKIILEIKKGQNINWPANISLGDAKKYNLVKYPDYFISDSLKIIIDLTNQTYIKIDGEEIVEYNIIKNEKNKFGYFFELYIPNKDVNSKLTLTEMKDSGYVFILQYSSNYGEEKLNGFFTKNDDLIINYEY